jgi:hypothetical protein
MSGYPWSNFQTLTADDLNAAIGGRQPSLPVNAPSIGTDGAGNSVVRSNSFLANIVGLTAEEDFFQLLTTNQVTVIKQWGQLLISGNGSGGTVSSTFYFPINFPTTCEHIDISLEGLFNPALGPVGYYRAASDYLTYVTVDVVNIYGTWNCLANITAIGY